jgi:hypothetical protein
MKKNLYNYSEFIIESDNIFYIYVYLDPTKPGKYEYDSGLKFEYLPFYVGYSNKKAFYDRKSRHLHFAKMNKDLTNNSYKMNIINKIIKNGDEPIILLFKDDLTFTEAKEMEIYMISKVGNRYDSSGPLVNIAKGGDGGDTFTNNPRKEEIREIHRKNATGSNNNMYGLPIEEYPSHKAKLRGEHWNMGRTASISTKELLSKQRTGASNSRAKKALLFDKDFNLVKEFDYCFDISDYIDSTKRAVSKTASTNAKEEKYPYHTTKGYYIIYKYDWETKFKNKENEIREYLRTFKKNKNQFS